MHSSIALARIQAIGRHIVPVRNIVPTYNRLQSPPTRWLAAAANRSHLHPSHCALFSTNSSQKSLLPPQSDRDSGRLTVVLDMDETLLHSHLVNVPPAGVDPRSVDDHEDERAAQIKDKKAVDFFFEIGGKFDKQLVKSTLRPGLKEFLHAVSEEFEPILLTSAMEIYASPLLDKIDGADTPKELKQLWRHRLYRPSTVSIGQFSYVKDVSRLGRDMKRVVLIDNSWAACVANPDNCIVVPDYLNQREDDVLEKVLAMLRQLKNEPDVRPALIKMVRFREQITKAGIQLPTDTAKRTPTISE